MLCIDTVIYIPSFELFIARVNRRVYIATPGEKSSSTKEKHTLATLGQQGRLIRLTLLGAIGVTVSHVGR